ncbi:hypothetical protein DL89DRAFT_167661 [Linderina pennispora]|uniref:Uncharacterized protein n=1 Tax=Linderina pennispora TaxID=61395 RepID=A0A1Y1VTM9_9FUNG|nr:uncharacterized protein DL89DRAFT_167661 [Linderina pennispora]ORX64638.1 hypothetical protein DL89DRAFT_167661 [Linderina pennispora]
MNMEVVPVIAIPKMLTVGFLVEDDEEQDTIATRQIACTLLRKPSTVQHAEVIIITSIPVSLPDAMLWVGLKSLSIQFPVYLIQLVGILPQLPHLQWLLVGAILRCRSTLASCAVQSDMERYSSVSLSFLQHRTYPNCAIP